MINARVMAETLVKRGMRIISGRTESHLMLVDLRAKNITGKDAEALLGDVHITINKNAIPKDPQKPMVTSGIRLGSPGITTRAFGAAEAAKTADLIADIIDKPGDAVTIDRAKREVADLTQRFPVCG
jgi:glycine hydroxymethyltransferase